MYKITNKFKTLDAYRKKYRHYEANLAVLTKKEVEEFDILNNCKGEKRLLNKNKWALIKDKYYQIPKAPTWTWFSNLNPACQFGTALILAGGITCGSVLPFVLKKGGVTPIQKEKMSEEDFNKAIDTVLEASNYTMQMYAKEEIEDEPSFEYNYEYKMDNNKKTFVDKSSNKDTDGYYYVDDNDQKYEKIGNEEWFYIKKYPYQSILNDVGFCKDYYSDFSNINDVYTATIKLDYYGSYELYKIKIEFDNENKIKTFSNDYTIDASGGKAHRVEQLSFSDYDTTTIEESSFPALPDSVNIKLTKNYWGNYETEYFDVPAGDVHFDVTLNSEDTVNTFYFESSEIGEGTFEVKDDEGNVIATTLEEGAIKFTNSVKGKHLKIKVNCSEAIESLKAVLCLNEKTVYCNTDSLDLSDRNINEIYCPSASVTPSEPKTEIYYTSSNDEDVEVHLGFFNEQGKLIQDVPTKKTFTPNNDPIEIEFTEFDQVQNGHYIYIKEVPAPSITPTCSNPLVLNPGNTIDFGFNNEFEEDVTESCTVDDDYDKDNFEITKDTKFHVTAKDSAPLGTETTAKFHYNDLEYELTIKVTKEKKITIGYFSDKVTFDEGNPTVFENNKGDLEFSITNSGDEFTAEISIINEQQETLYFKNYVTIPANKPTQLTITNNQVLWDKANNNENCTVIINEQEPKVLDINSYLSEDIDENIHICSVSQQIDEKNSTITIKYYNESDAKQYKLYAETTYGSTFVQYFNDGNPVQFVNGGTEEEPLEITIEYTAWEQAPEYPENTINLRAEATEF